MARGKNAPALFEVIRNAQEKQRQQEQRLREQRLREETAKAAGGSTPAVSGTAAVNKLKSSLVWLKNKSASATGSPAGPVMREVSEVPNVEVKPPVTARLETNELPRSAMAYEEAERVEVPLAEERPTAPTQAAPPYRPAIADLARQMREEIAAGNEAERETPHEAPAAEPFFDSRPPRSYLASTESDTGDDSNHAATGPEFAIDRDNRQISLKVSYNSAIITGFAVVVALGLAYVIGSAGRSKTTSVAESNPQPDVLKVDSQQTSNTDGTPGKTPSSDGMANINTDNNLGVENANGGPVTVPKNFKRVINLNYVVLMSSPSTHQLQDLVKFLADHGVGATVEQLPGFSKKTTWYSVVTTKGFDKVSNNPQLDVFLARLNQLMQQYSKTSNFPPGKPALFMWKSPSA